MHPRPQASHSLQRGKFAMDRERSAWISPAFASPEDLFPNYYGHHTLAGLRITLCTLHWHWFGCFTKSIAPPFPDSLPVLGRCRWVMKQPLQFTPREGLNVDPWLESTSSCVNSSTCLKPPLCFTHVRSLSPPLQHIRAGLSQPAGYPHKHPLQYS